MQYAWGDKYMETFSWEILQRKGHLRDLGVNGRMILKWV
jgi:hypothetical protein